MRTIVFDVDGVLKHWTEGFVEHVRAVEGVAPAFEAPLPGCAPLRVLRSLYPAFDDARLRGLFAAFNASPAFEELPDVQGAFDGVEAIRQRHPGMAIVAVTSAGVHPATVAARASHVYEFGIETVHILPMGADKTPYFRLYGDAIVVEDSHSGLDQAQAAGCRAICFDQPYNRDWVGPRAASWATLPDLVAGFVSGRIAA